MRWALIALALIASPAAAQVITAPSSSVDTTARNAAAAAQTAADNAATAASSAVKTVNGVSPTAGAVTVAIPTASTTIPPCISDAGTAGTAGTMQFAPFNHTHCSKARRAIFTTAADGTYTWTFPTAFTGSPVCTAVAEVASGVTDVVNVQIIGTPTTTSATFLVNRAQRSTQILNLVSITLLSIPTSPGATKVHAICIEP